MKTLADSTLKVVFASLLCCIWLTATTAMAGTTIRVKDSNRTEHIFNAPPQRVVSLVPSATEILFEIGADQAILGLTYHDATLKGAEEKTVIGGFFQPSVKRITSLRPDMVILADFHKEIRTALIEKGLAVFVYDTDNIEQSFETIKNFGILFEKQEEARAVIEKNKHQIDLIQKKLAKAVPDKRKRVIRLMGRDKVMTPGSDSFQNELIRLAGGIAPDFGRKGSIIEVTKEEWTQFNPQVIYGCTGDKKVAEKFFSQTGWDQVDAVKNQQIFYFPCELTCRAASHSGYFVQWLSSTIYTDVFAQPEKQILLKKIIGSKQVPLNLDYVKMAAINTATIYDFENKTLIIDFKNPQTIVSTLEGQMDNILTVGNHYSPPSTWGPGHKMGIDNIRANILAANKKDRNTTSFLITGADMDNLSIREATFKEMKVTALVTAGVMSNAVRMSKDTGFFYEPGTINIIIMTNMKLSNRAMTRAIIAATEAKTAALEDMDIRSSATPLQHEATGTGTDNVLVVKGEGTPINNAGGHSKMGELIAKAVYAGVNEAILNQNKVTAKRHIFQRLKERKISLHSLTSGVNCDCLNQKNIAKQAFSKKVEHLLLEKEIAAFIEIAFAVSDEYEKGLIKDLTLFNGWCKNTASKIAGKKVSVLQDYLAEEKIPLVLKTALNTIFTGAMEQLSYE